MSATGTATSGHGFYPSAHLLHQNYPNPINPAIIVEYSIPPSAGRNLVLTGVLDEQIPYQSLVALKVFDLLGREVATLVNEKKEAGRHSVQTRRRGRSGRISLVLPQRVDAYPCWNKKGVVFGRTIAPLGQK
ncbi:MAG: hypothetical protein NTV54_09715 [Ignavibacteriales bacterium]|nr:hypothetical protein [Ignavibacteriales bacterium]